MAGHSSLKVVFAALAGNTLIAVTKFGAAAYTGSSAMLSEAIHSLVDTGNQGLLLFGIKRAARPADAEHPFGYAREIYFWSFVVAILIFAVGSGVSIYEGIQKIIHPHPITSPVVNYIVLGLALVFEGAAWWIAYNEFNKTKGKKGLFESIHKSKDPTIFTVLFEDTAAILGLAVAVIGIACTDYFGLEMADGIASVIIGFILAGAAILLAYETKGLLIGEAASDELVAGVQEIVSLAKNVEHLNELRTMHMGPDDVLLALSLDYRDGLTSQRIEDCNYELEKAIKLRFPQIKRLYLEVQSQDHHEEAEMTLEQ
ncbi:MAG TPA: cation transporter [Rhizobiales bacterium]|nr:cation transporter [Hyphomicrobiales bacterium]